MGDMDLGISLGADWFFANNSALRENTPVSTEAYSFSQETRYEVALRTGSEQGMFYPFFKIGAVAGTWATKVNTNMGSVNTRDLLWGATIGGGLDYKLHMNGSLGFIVEGDWYANKSYDLNNGAGASYAKLETNPWALNVALTYKYKFA